MRTHIGKYFAAAAVLAMLLLAQGCVKKDALKIHGVEDISISMQGGTRINALLRVENTSGSNMKLLRVDCEVSDMQGRVIAELTVEDEVHIPKRTVTNVLLPMKVTLVDPIAGLRLFRDIDGMSRKAMVSGTATVKYGCMKRKHDFENVPLSKIMESFDPGGPMKTPRIIDGNRN